MDNNKIILPSETLLDDDYPVYYGYAYVADGKVISSDIQGSVAELRKDLESQNISAKEIRRCDIFGRQAALKNK